MFNSLFTASSLFSKALKLDLAERCFIEFYDGKYLVGKDGSLATVLRIDGLKDMKSFLDLNYFLNRASKMLNSPLGQRGRALQIWYECNPDLAASQARELVYTPRVMAERLGLDMKGFLDDREAYLAKRLIPDAFYFVLWTRQGVLTRHEAKLVSKEKPPSWWPGARLSQDLFKAIPKLRTKHSAWVNEILNTLRTLGLSVTQMNGHESVAGLRRNFRPNVDHSRYRGWLPGDPIPKDENCVARMPGGEAGIPSNDVSHLLWPQIGPLAVDDIDAEAISGRIIRLGEIFYAPLEMKVGPQEPQAFSNLYRRLAADTLPWRMSILLEGEGDKAFWLKKALATVAGWSSEETKMIKENLDAAAAVARSGTSIMRTRICFGTWGPSIKETETRLAQLQQAVESWGTCITSSGGDPLVMSFSTMAALDPASAATSGLATIKGALRFGPWARSASPLSRGSTVFVTEESTAWNWMPGNSLQDAPVEIVIGPMGKGKSVMMATLAMSFILSPNSNASGVPKLPRYSLLDVGPSSYGLIEALRNMLPAHRKDEAQYHRMTMDPHYSINFLDLQPGLRAPLKVERMFIINMLCAMVTPTGETKVPGGLAELAGQVVDEAYRKFSDDPTIAGTPKLWSPGEDSEIDQILAKIGFDPVQGVTTWYQICDLLHDRGHTNEAILAQRNASPMLADLMAIVKSPAIEDTWRGATLGTGESMIQVFWRAIANTLREYPIFSRPTQFHLGIGRVVALDLQHVTGGGSDAADRRTGIMFMLGRYMLTRNYYTSKDSAMMAPPNWRNWHEARAREAQESPSRFAMDEFHRTAKVPAIQSQVETDVREGRKFNIQIILASQIETDFPPAILQLASCIWVLGCNTDAGARSIADIFGLSEAAVESIPLFLLGPGPRGAPFMALLNMKDGRHEHRLYNVIGPSEAWAYSTSPDDVTLRQRISMKMPFFLACRQLGRLFPTGSAGSMLKEIRDNDPTAKAFDIVEERVLKAA